MGRTKSGDWYEFDIDGVDPNKFKADLGPSD